MNKIILTLSLIIIGHISYSQITFFNYLDYTSEWRYYGGGWNGFNSYDCYETRYFDGDETVNGIVYYKEYSIRVWTENYTIPETTIYYNGPFHVREDASGKFYRLNPNNGLEDLILDNQIILNAQIGDSFPYPGATCDVQTIETVYLGSVPLKKIKGINTGIRAGTLEGVGVLGLACATGIEGNGGLQCYSKQGITLQFGTMDCNSFPTPIHSSLSINKYELNKSQFKIYPNPTNNNFRVLSNSNEAIDYEILTIDGVLVLKGGFKYDEEKNIDISNFENTVYILKIKEGNSVIYEKIIKD